METTVFGNMKSLLPIDEDYLEFVTFPNQCPKCRKTLFIFDIHESSSDWDDIQNISQKESVQDMHVFHQGQIVHIRRGCRYFIHNPSDRIFIGYQQSYNPPCDIEDQSLFDFYHNMFPCRNGFFSFKNVDDL